MHSVGQVGHYFFHIIYLKVIIEYPHIVDISLEHWVGIELASSDIVEHRIEIRWFDGDARSLSDFLSINKYPDGTIS